MGEHTFPYNSSNPVPTGQPGWLWHTWPSTLTMLEYTEDGQSLDNTAIIWPTSVQTTPGTGIHPSYPPNGFSYPKSVASQSASGLSGPRPGQVHLEARLG